MSIFNVPNIGYLVVDSVVYFTLYSTVGS